jgi:hypothetical protein
VYCAYWVAALASPVLGQGPPREQEPDAFLNQQRLIEQRIAEELQEALPADRRTTVDYGGWYSLHLFLYDDGVNSSRTLRRNDLRLWSRVTLQGGAHEIFARGRLSFLDFNSGDSFDGNDDDWEGPSLERGYYQFDLGRARAAHGGKALPYNLQFKIGRDLVTFGTGYAFSVPLDYVQLAAEAGDVRLTGLVGETVGSLEDFDRSRNTTRTRRTFFGVEGRYFGFERHEPFAYVVWQADHNHDTFPHPLQGYDYDSFYIGLGSEGELSDNVRYSTEWVYESGRSYGHRRFAKRDVVRAWAFEAELEYLSDDPHRPRASIEYLFASGDEDRLLSPTDTVGGNRGDYTDTSFIGFGWHDTGLSLAPRMSNIHVWRGGASFFPFPERDGPQRLAGLELGADAYMYWKHHRAGAISDFTADRQSGYLGWELDFYANWKITTDLGWTARYGVFFPGKAFSDRTTRTFLLVGVTWSF